MPQYLHDLHTFFTGELGRIVATFLLTAIAVSIHRLNVRYVSMAGKVESLEWSRQRLVASKNILFILAALGIGAIWATKIAGVALSLAAFAGALVLSAKELIMCAMGYVLYTISRPYRVGDYIKVQAVAGRVIDVNFFTTTVAETAAADQLSGRRVTFPNSFLLTNAVENVSATGDFVVSLLRIVLPYDVNRERAEEIALKAGQEVCESWLQRADEHFRRIEAEDYLDLPSSRVKILWEPCDVKQHWMTIRIASPVGQRVAAQQEVLRRFWKEMGVLKSSHNE
jgi:small-conductance mechanosensitive channel